MSKKTKYDITLRIKGGNKSGALSSDDLKKVAEFMTSVASQDDSLGDLYLVDVKPGSVEACFCIDPSPAYTETLGVYTREEQNNALRAIFDQGQNSKSAPLSLPADVSESLRPWTRIGRDLEISYRANPNGRLKTIAIDPKMLEKSVPKPPKVLEKRWVVGRVVRLIKDEQLYGIDTEEGVLLCPMDETKNSQYLNLYEKAVMVDVLASFPAKAQSGPWKAKAIHEIVLRKESIQPKEPTPLLHDVDVCNPCDIGDIPGMTKPKKPQTFGTSLASFAAALTPEDGESLAAFLRESSSR